MSPNGGPVGVLGGELVIGCDLFVGLAGLIQSERVLLNIPPTAACLTSILQRFLFWTVVGIFLGLVTQSRPDVDS